MVAKDTQGLTSNSCRLASWILLGCEHSNTVTSGNHVKRNTEHVDKQRQRFSYTGRNPLQSCGRYVAPAVLVVRVVAADDGVSDSPGDDDDNYCCLYDG